MSKEDIDRAVKEAEKFAEEDKKQQEAVEAKNQAENLIYQSEKTLADLGDKVTDEEKAQVNSAIAKLRETVKGENTEAIKADTEELQKAFYSISEKLYQQQEQQQDPGAGSDGQTQHTGGTENDTYYNTDYEDKT